MINLLAKKRLRLAIWFSILLLSLTMALAPIGSASPDGSESVQFPILNQGDDKKEEKKDDKDKQGDDEKKSGPTFTKTPFKDSPMPELTGKGDKVLIVKLHEEFHQPLLYSFRRAGKMTKSDKSIRAVVIDMNTPGGSVGVLKEIIAILNNIDVPVYLYVEDMAISAGALLSFATQGIYMRPNSHIGDAAPIWANMEKMGETEREKIQSFLRSMVRALAQNNGYRQEVGICMIDINAELKYGDKLICNSDELLTITAKEAADIMPDGKPLHCHGLVDSLEDLLVLKGLDKAERIVLQHSAADKLARILTMLAPILFTLAIIGLYVEMNTPGFGIPGLMGIICLVIALFGHHVAGLAGMEEMVLMLVGIILLALEIFVIPGFGIAGISGIACLLGGFIWMMIPHIPKSPPNMPDLPELDLIDSYLRQALINLIATVALCALLFWLLRKILPKTVMFRKLVLQHSATKQAGYSGTDEHKHVNLVDATGDASTDLRPSGIAIINGKRVDVVTQGGYIRKGERIKVKEVKGVRVVVVKAGEKEDSPDNADSAANEPEA